ncbi:MAG: aldose 1-epimerase family protein [Planctomycetaceae bacterium]
MSSQTLQLITSHRGASFSAADRVDVALGRLAVRTRRLSGGLREGVLLVELAAGDTKVFILPDRGLGIWKIIAGGVELGWQSPVHGPVNPRFVPLAEPTGLGWLDGFDELVARCGLVSNGAPDFDAAGRLAYGLHGRIANLPAHHLDVTLDEADGTITLTGAVDETRFLCHSLRMTTSLTLHADRHRVSWTDSVKNISDRSATMQMLYHVNLGPPLLGPGSEVVAAVEELAPRDSAAVADVPTWNRYVAPQAGRGEQVHFARVRAGADGVATALLVGPDARNAVSLSWTADTLPCFSLWKNQGGLADGYVTGLEPGTNYPNPRSFEESQGRVVSLAPGEAVRFDLAIEHFAGPAIDAERRRVTGHVAPVPAIHSQPRVGWSRP